MTSHELARELLERPNRPVVLRVVNDRDAGADGAGPLRISDFKYQIEIMAWEKSDSQEEAEEESESG